METTPKTNKSEAVPTQPFAKAAREANAQQQKIAERDAKLRFAANLIDEVRRALPKPVIPSGGAALLDAVETALRRKVIMSEAERVATVLWIAHTYVYDRFPFSPRLFVTSLDASHGKSRLLRTVAELANGATMMEKTTVAYLGRIKGEKGAALTVLLDQLDHMNKDHTQQIDSLCSGAESGSKAGLVEKSGDGTLKPVEFEFFYPVALGKIGPLPNKALRSRCLTIRMHPATQQQCDELEKHAAGPIDPKLREALRGWLAGLAPEPVSFPPGIFNRDRDKWRPLLTIAEAAGGAWPERAREAAIKLEEEDGAEPLHVQLARHLMAALAKWTKPQIFGEELDGLLEKQGQKLLAAQRAKLLSDMGCKSRTVRRDKETRKGYAAAEMMEAIKPYVPPEPPV